MCYKEAVFGHSYINFYHVISTPDRFLQGLLTVFPTQTVYHTATMCDQLIALTVH